jgi:hypothetical protein
MDERSTVPDGYRPGRLEEVHETIRRSRRRRTSVGAVAATGVLAVGVLSGPTLLPLLGLVEPARDTTVEPAASTGRTEDTKGGSEQAKPFRVRLDDLGDAEKLVGRLRGQGIEAVAVDEVLDVSDPSAVLGHLANGTLRHPTAAPAGSDFTIHPDKIADGRIIVAMGMVDDLSEGKPPASWQRPIIIHERQANDLSCSSSHGNGPDADERVFQVYLAGQDVPGPTCSGDGSSR